MATLTGNKIKDSYLGLLKSISNGAISSSFVQISDGGGNALPLYLSTSSIKFYNAYTFPSADGTVSGQVLSTDANGTLSWVTSSDNQTLEEVLTQGNTTTIAISSSADITTTAQFNGDINGALLQKVKAAEALSKGDVVYISGGTGDNPEVSKANASDSTKMPALGIMKENLNNINDEGECITSGELTGLNLSSSGTIGDFDTGDELFVSSTTAGGLVDTAPTGVANLIQKIGKVINGGNGGALTVLGAFRTNAMPNLPTGILLGDTTNVATAITDGSSGQILSTDGNGTYSFIDDNAITSAVSPLNLSANQISLGTVPVTKGGTGATTLTGILLGNATSAISGITSAVDGHVLTADGNGGYAFEVASGGNVTVNGASVGNRVAVWNNTSGELRSTSAIATENSNIYLVQPSTNETDKFNYIIGGAFAINENDFGTQNTGFGHAVLNGANLTGGNNSSFGMQSQTALTTGSYNTSIGSFAMYDNRSGDYNVGLGAKTMFNQRISNNNVSIGYDSMDGVVASRTAESNNNVAIGYESLHIIEGGDNNTVLGYQSGSEITTGSNNVIIGSNTGSTIPTTSNNIIISDGSGNNRIQVDSGGNVGIGVTPTDAHQISRTSGTTQDAKNIQLRIGSSTTSLSPYIRFQGQTSSSVNRFADIQLDTVNDLLSFFPPSQYANAPSALNISSVGDATFSGDVEIKNSVVPTLKLNNTDTSLGSQTLGSIEYYQNDASDQGVGTVSRINCVNESSFSGLGALTFETGNATSITERLRISSGGAAQFKSVKGSGESLNVKILDSNTNYAQGTGGGLLFQGIYQNNGNVAGGGAIQISKVNSNNGDYSYDMDFYTRPLGSAITKRLTISSGGAANFSNHIYSQSTLLTTDGTTANYRWQTYNNASDDAYVINSRNIGDVFKIGYTTGEVRITSTFASNTFPFRVGYLNSSSVYTPTFAIDDNGETTITATSTSGLIIAQSGQSYYHKIRNQGDGLYIGVDDGGQGGAGADLRINIKGSEKMRISSGGDVTIGSANDPYLYMVSSGGNGYNSRFRMYGYADGGTYGGGFKIDTRNSSNVFNNALAISSVGTLITVANSNNGSTAIFKNNSSTTPYGISVELPNGSSDDTRYLFYGGLASNAPRFKVSTSGKIYALDTSQIYSISDVRFKENIRDLDTGLSEILQLKPRLFDWKEGKGTDTKNSVGFIAQEVEEILPKLVDNNWSQDGLDEKGAVIEGEKYKTVGQIGLIPTLVKAIQEQQTIIEDLKSRIEQLEL